MCQVSRPILIRSERQGRSWKALKRGSRGRDRPEVARRERLLLVPAPELHLDVKGAASPAPGSEPVGFERKDQPHRNPRHRRGCAKQLEYRMMEGSCRSVEVASYLNALAEQAHTEGKPCVVVLDNASFHTARMVREREGEWEEKGLVLYRLPAYCPQLNLIEAVWRRLKGFLMPRRFYDSVAELREAVLRALHLLGAVEIQCLLGGT